MIRSIFDPKNPHVEQGGDVFTGSSAQQNSHMPESVTDGVVENDAPDTIVEFDADGRPVKALDPDRTPQS